MSHSINHDPTDWALPQALPFSGLGFDLEAVARYAAQLTLAPCVANEGRRWLETLQMPVAGYALQLMLGRETRAG